MTEKILGYLLITVGVAIIVYSAINVVNVFSKRSSPVKPLNLPGISLDMSKLVGGDITPEQKTQLENADLRAEIVKPELLNQPLNLAAHLFLMGFIASVGFKIASLGVMLVRPIKVTLKESSKNQKLSPG